jgi:hypothetical protein
VKKRFKPITLESFDPVTQESHNFLPATIHTQEIEEKIKIRKTRAGLLDLCWQAGTEANRTNPAAQD